MSLKQTVLLWFSLFPSKHSLEWSEWWDAGVVMCLV